MVCWNETRDAARAVSAAMPLLGRARRVVVASVRESEAEATALAVEEVARGLAWNNIAAEAQTLERDGRATADVLSAAAASSGADPMIVGAYGHRRLCEMLFGGCTQSAIEGAHCAVFLVH